MSKVYTVAVFQHPREDRKDMWLAYLRDYSPDWPGCVLVQVFANSGTEAKRLAIAEAKAKAGAK